MKGTVVEGVIGRVKGRHLVVDKRSLSVQRAAARDSFKARQSPGAAAARVIFVDLQFPIYCCSLGFLIF
jgi:hypothetical protein